MTDPFSAFLHALESRTGAVGRDLADVLSCPGELLPEGWVRHELTGLMLSESHLLLGDLLMAAGRGYLGAGRHLRALSAFEAAKWVFSTHGFSRGALRAGVGWLEAALQRKGMDLPVKAPSSCGASSALVALEQCYWGELLARHGRSREAEAALSQAVKEARGSGDVAIEVRALLGLGILSREEGNCDQAELWAEEARIASESIRYLEGRAWASLQLSDLHLLRGSYFTARRLSRLARSLFRRLDIREGKALAEARCRELTLFLLVWNAFLIAIGAVPKLPPPKA